MKTQKQVSIKKMTYIIEKKIGKSPQFYEDAWQPCWEHMKRDYLDFGEVPPGYEAICITQKQGVAADAVLYVFGANSDEAKNLKKCWSHLEWDFVEEMARQCRPYNEW